jgi:hypothetical protein
MAVAPCLGGEQNAVDLLTGHCYQLFVQQKHDWTTASMQCAALGPKEHLVTVESAAEQAVVVGLGGNAGRVWMGGNDQAQLFKFVWVTGEPFVFTDWETGEPNGSGHCVDLVGARWHDNYCVYNEAYMCEREP